MFQNNNLHFINLPAGSGKTTHIKEQVCERLIKEPDSHILVITYTNRAVKELEKQHFDSHVEISTIHSFIAKQIEPFFGVKNIVDAYFECFENEINNFLKDNKKKERIKKFQEENNLVSFPASDNIKQLTARVKYGRRQYGDYLHAELSHDDLLKFYVFLIDKYPMFKYRVGEKYQLIIVDECQDTDPQVLGRLASIAQGFSIECYVYGDLMQQIFNEDEKELRNALNCFNLDRPESIINYRSAPQIVKMLNKLYNDKSLDQQPSEKLRNCKSVMELYISNDQKQTVKSIRGKAERNNEPLPMSLVVFKKERFEHYGLSEIYDAYDRLVKYEYGNRFNVLDVLLPEHYDGTPDDIVKFMFTIVRLKKSAESNQFSSIVQILKKDFHKSYNSLLDTNGVISVDTLSKYIEELRGITKFSNCTVKQILDWASSRALVEHNWAEGILKEDVYTKVKVWKNKEAQVRENAYVKNVKLEQFEKLYELVEHPEKSRCSTQHGVKGEGYESIIFEMEDSLNYKPFLPMYQCMRLLIGIDSFNIDYLFNKYNEIQEYQKEPTVDAMVDAMKSYDRSNNSKLFYETILEEIKQKKDYNKKSEKEKKETYKKYAVDLMTAFRIFYVGCSRAKRILRVVMNEEELENLKITNSVNGKFKELGFKVIQDE